MGGSIDLVDLPGTQTPAQTGFKGDRAEFFRGPSPRNMAVFHNDDPIGKVCEPP